MINWTATNTTGSYCLRQGHTCHIASSLLGYSMC